MASIYNQMIEAGVEVSSHESDLYVPVNDITNKIISNYKHKHNCTRFANNIDGKLWIDIPFAYDPWWTARGCVN